MKGCKFYVRSLPSHLHIYWIQTILFVEGRWRSGNFLTFRALSIVPCSKSLRNWKIFFVLFWLRIGGSKSLEGSIKHFLIYESSNELFSRKIFCATFLRVIAWPKAFDIEIVYWGFVDVRYSVELLWWSIRCTCFWRCGIFWSNWTGYVWNLLESWVSRIRTES